MREKKIGSGLWEQRDKSRKLTLPYEFAILLRVDEREMTKT